MLRKDIYTVIGGDLRLYHVANLIIKTGATVNIYGIPMSAEEGAIKLRDKDIYSTVLLSDYVILPLPLSRDGKTLNAPYANMIIDIDELFSHIKPGAVVFAGMVSGDVQKIAENKNITLLDYFAREEFAVLNAIPTAEGAVGIAMEELEKTINSSKCIVTGFGRISKILAVILKAMGARVYVAARNYSDFAYIKAYGYNKIEISEIKKHVTDADVIFNTVPHRIITEEVLGRLPRDCLVIDLASKPGGVDFTAAKEYMIKTIHALSLPGKVAPVTAGKIIYDTILNMLRERGETYGKN